jgi:deoxyribodipyrimidine photolyase-related protein
VEISFVFPNQLYKNHPALKQGRKVLMIEDDLFFGQYAFHKQKLVLHRASMKAYADYLVHKGFQVDYLNHTQSQSLSAVFQKLKAQGITSIHVVEPVDYLLTRRIVRYTAKEKVQVVQYPNPNFVCTPEFYNSFFAKKKRYFQTEFYIELRKQHQIMMEGDQPAGGDWTYDTMNRQKMPKEVTPPTLPEFKKNKFVQEAIDYINNNFSENYGSVEGFNYPIAFKDAELALDNFLKERFEHYGIYQDAIVQDQSVLFHSVLTPALNIGLLSPEEILKKAETYFLKHNTPINSTEGFIRQILGWREFIRAVYMREGVKERTTNHFNHIRKIPSSFYTGTTGIEPIDNVIKRILQTGYANHIERLMVLGNFMLLCEFDPDDIYCWFMELFIDAYDWVMVPNVYGMSQFADGGLMATKPYISSSNYILKMSHYKSAPWCEVWDGLYWRFIAKHQLAFIKNPRMSMMVKQLEKMDKQKKERLFNAADRFLNTLA